MPKVKYLDTPRVKKEKWLAGVKRDIEIAMARTGVTAGNMADGTGLQGYTIRERFNDVGSLTLSNLYDMSVNALKFTERDGAIYAFLRGGQ